MCFYSECYFDLVDYFIRFVKLYYVIFVRLRKEANFIWLFYFFILRNFNVLNNLKLKYILFFLMNVFYITLHYQCYKSVLTFVVQSVGCIQTSRLIFLKHTDNMHRKSKGPPSKNSNSKKNRKKRKRRSRKEPRVKIPIEYDQVS